VLPSPETINSGTYHPLSRPLFLYINAKAAGRPEVQAFTRFYLEQAKGLVPQVGYVPVPDRIYELARQRFEEKQTGSVFAGQGLPAGLSLEKLLQGKSE
ncbi:MAG: protein sphX, partial [Acidobacteria bacterium]|nr:protein sphX [Acidobacteriota bacterium]